LTAAVDIGIGADVLLGNTLTFITAGYPFVTNVSMFWFGGWTTLGRRSPKTSSPRSRSRSRGRDSLFGQPVR
jgi:hypothetical protein